MSGTGKLLTFVGGALDVNLTSQMVMTIASKVVNCRKSPWVHVFDDKVQ